MDQSTPKIRFTLRQLQYFCAVARTGQISVAAAQCHITQPTMTAAVAELERALGLVLFRRERRGVSLTEAGSAFLQRAQAVLESAVSASGLAEQSVDSGLTGTVHIGATETLVGYALLPLVSRFQECCPSVTVVPVQLQTGDVEAALECGQIDLAAARLAEFHSHRRLARRTLTRVRRRVWVGDGHPLSERSSVALKDLAPYRFVVVGSGEDAGDAAPLWQQAGVPQSNVLRTASVGSARELIASGLAVTVLSDATFWPWPPVGRRVRAIALDDDIPLVDVGLLWHLNQPMTPWTAALRDHLSATFALPPDLQEGLGEHLAPLDIDLIDSRSGSPSSK
ncbi:LysR family transcriptional regulator [Piscinibacter gummiphilus]|uniref:Uncharacterized protein n=1 Tax=Piscinibacter gummiphilus TaxID=946333 RepID=A0A1W6L5L9_9BURK|nr:LysR family transcriptional regulator [Piscinibacter gummiphilus]ARN19619.1 hypothetical protein A4W93_06635 [Piscinibacter gummiphilus]GLS93487.1 LysR family transcriptional regulator [Piscinibacter gummiphilus]